MTGSSFPRTSGFRITRRPSAKHPTNARNCRELLQSIPQYGGSYSIKPDGTQRGASDPRLSSAELNEMEKKLDAILEKLGEQKKR